MAWSSPTARDRERFNTLLARKDQFERELGQKAEWVGDLSHARVRVSTPLDIDDREQWPAAIDWLTAQHPRWLHAIDAVGACGGRKSSWPWYRLTVKVMERSERLVFRYAFQSCRR